MVLTSHRADEAYGKLWEGRGPNRPHANRAEVSFFDLLLDDGRGEVRRAAAISGTSGRKC